jgi:hypothetical protein
MKRSRKSLPDVEIISYGRYTRWNDDSRELPELQELTNVIPAAPDIEFGIIIEIRHGKGRYIEFIVHHPSFKDKNGI